jgi:hypothetical protein
MKNPPSPRVLAAVIERNHLKGNCERKEKKRNVN